APDQLNHIFEEFYQVGVSPNSSRDGYGLGLSIVQRIVKLLGIPIEVKSTPGEGSVFAIELPRCSPTEETAAAATTKRAGRASGADSQKVLVVEDEPGVRSAMRMLLKIEGFEVTAV